jgi:hypothetical protein
MDEAKKTQPTTTLKRVMLEIQKVMDSAKKTAENPYFHSRYSDLPSVNAAIRDAMKASKAYVLIEQVAYTDYTNLEVRPLLVKDKQGNILKTYDVNVPLVGVLTRISEPQSGEFEESTMKLRPVEDTPQAVGSTISYIRRYSLLARFNISSEDDDGNSGSGKTDRQQPEKQRPATQTGPAKPETTPPLATTKPPATQTPAKPSDEAQKAAGLIMAAEVDFLGNLAAEKKIPPAQMAVWLMGIYGHKNRWQIKAGDQYKAIVEYIRDCSDTIKNYGIKKAERQPGED